MRQMFLPGYLRQSEHRLSCYVWDERLHKLCQSLPRPPCLWREARCHLEFQINLFVAEGDTVKLNFISIFVCRGRYSKAEVKRITGCDFCWFSFNFDNHLRFRNYSRVANHKSHLNGFELPSSPQLMSLIICT